MKSTRCYGKIRWEEGGVVGAVGYYDTCGGMKRLIPSVKKFGRHSYMITLLRIESFYVIKQQTIRCFGSLENWLQGVAIEKNSVPVTKSVRILLALVVKGFHGV